MKKKKVMLMTLPKKGQVKDFTTPRFYQENPVRYMPLGILAVATGISSYFEVKILDADSWDYAIEETIEKIHEFAPDVLGISAVTRKVYALAEILKRVKGPIKAVGGPHTTIYAEEVLKLGADAVFQYDGDRNFNEWLLSGCPGGVFRDYIEKIDSLPIIRRDFVNLGDYILDSQKAKATLFKKSGARLAMFSSKGCPFHCIFCDVQEKKFRSFSPRRVVGEMEYLLDYGADAVHILDDCFNIIKERAVGVCEEIKRRNLNFPWSCRGRIILDDSVAAALKSAGCHRFHVGIESLDSDVLKWMNKGITVDAIKKFCDICHKHEIEIVAYFVLGSPLETREYREKLADMIKDLGIRYPFFNILYPAANTAYYRGLIADGTYKRDYWREFVENPTPDYEIPLPRSLGLQEELEETAARCIKAFFE